MKAQFKSMASAEAEAKQYMLVDGDCRDGVHTRCGSTEAAPPWSAAVPGDGAQVLQMRHALTDRRLELSLTTTASATGARRARRARARTETFLRCSGVRMVDGKGVSKRDGGHEYQKAAEHLRMLWGLEQQVDSWRPDASSSRGGRSDFTVGRGELEQRLKERLLLWPALLTPWSYVEAMADNGQTAGSGKGDEAAEVVVQDYLDYGRERARSRRKVTWPLARSRSWSGASGAVVGLHRRRSSAARCATMTATGETCAAGLHSWQSKRLRQSPVQW